MGMGLPPPHTLAPLCFLAILKVELETRHPPQNGDLRGRCDHLKRASLCPSSLGMNPSPYPP